MRARHAVLFSSLLALLLAGPVAAEDAVRWQPTLDAARSLAARTNQLILVHFWRSGCPPCAKMDRDVFSRPDVAAAIQRDYVPVKINKAFFPSTAAQFRVMAVPTDVILTPDGRVVQTHVGFTPADEFIGRLSQVAAAARPPADRYARQAVPPQPTPRSAAGPAPYAAPGFNAPTQPGPRSRQALAAAGPSPVEARRPQGRAIPPAVPSVQTARVDPRYSTPGGVPDAAPLRPTARPPQATRNPDYGAPLAGMAGGGGNSGRPGSPVGPWTPPATAGPATQPVPSRSNFAPSKPTPQTNMAARQPAAGNPPLALDGFCPVQLTENRRWVSGDPRWGLRHEGRTYLFSGPRQQQAFYENPERFAPVLSGNDVVLAVDQRQQVPGRREYGGWFHDRVYLFASEDTYRRFEADPQRYEAAALGQAPGRVQQGAPNSTTAAASWPAAAAAPSPY